jgi:hypothetical protein
MKKVATLLIFSALLFLNHQSSQAQAFERRKIHVGLGLGFGSGTSALGNAEYAFAEFLGLGAAADLSLTSPIILNLGLRGSYHFTTGGEELDPYVGATYFFTNGGNFVPHGGVRYYFTDKVGGMAELGINTAGSLSVQARLGVALKLGN